MLNRGSSGTTSLQERNWAEAEDDALYDVVDEAQYNELRNSRLKCVCSFTIPSLKPHRIALMLLLLSWAFVVFRHRADPTSLPPHSDPPTPPSLL